jgi:DNA-binding NarL/FixJ family response regulator
VIRVLLVDDHASFRQPLAFMLGREPDLTVVGQAGSLAEARALLRDVDVAVLDLDLPDGRGVALIADLHVASPTARVLVLTASAKRKELAETVALGADGALHKSAGLAEIITAVRRLGVGEPLHPPAEIIELLRLAGQEREKDQAAQASLRRLTPREREVLQALADGLNDREIAERLSMSVATARTHMVNILNKLGLQSRLQALVFAMRHGLVHIA